MDSLLAALSHRGYHFSYLQSLLELLCKVLSRQYISMPVSDLEKDFWKLNCKKCGISLVKLRNCCKILKWTKQNVLVMCSCQLLSWALQKYVTCSFFRLAFFFSVSYTSDEVNIWPLLFEPSTVLLLSEERKNSSNKRGYMSHPTPFHLS